MPIYEVILAIGLGKLLKYSLYAYVVSRFPRCFVRWYAAALPGQVTVAGEAGTASEPVSIESVQEIKVRRWWVRRTPR